MGVVQPYVNGIGGDLFMIYYEAKTGKVYGLNSSGWTPKALTIETLKAKGVTEINPIGVETIDVPGDRRNTATAYLSHLNEISAISMPSP